MADKEDFTIDDARKVIIVRAAGGRYLSFADAQHSISPIGIAGAIAGTPHVRIIPTSKRPRVTVIIEPVTVIGADAVRTFSIDIENVNNAFNHAMKRHVPRTA